MKDEAFNELLESVRQAVKISRGEMQPSRVFRIDPVDVKAIREKACKTQESADPQYVEHILRPEAVTV